MRVAPRVFVASSTESLPLAEAIKETLKAAEVKLWTECFKPSETLIDGLDRVVQQFDYGIAVFAPDDKIVRRGQAKKRLTVRDNVMLEHGMFIGRHGPRGSFIVQPEGSRLELPDDLNGVITARYDSELAKTEPAAALGKACRSIEEAINIEQRRRTKELKQRMTAALKTVCELTSLPRTPQDTSLRAFIFRQEKGELVCRYFWDPYKSKEAVGETRFQIDEKTASQVAVVHCFLKHAGRSDRKDETEVSSVAPLPRTFTGIKGEIKRGVKHVLPAPIRNEDDTIWGVVDFDVSNDKGKRLLLQNEKISEHVILRLAEHLSTILAH